MAIARRTADPLRSLNAVCPYYTMFPLEFPLRVLQGRRARSGWVVDPFCGRGTTNFAARLLGLPTFGVDSNPVAVALTQAKLADARAGDVVRVARVILTSTPDDVEVPTGAFWRRAYAPPVLRALCGLRDELLRDCGSDSRVLLRAIVLGALHGPRAKGTPSYFSNQSPRTFAPKPAYAVRFWRERKMHAPRVDVLDVIRTRAERFLEHRSRPTTAKIVLGDSRSPQVFAGRKFRWAITSPPYYGMRTYVADQWLRYWFLGGPDTVEYHRPNEELDHTSADEFADGLRKVWKNLATHAADDARLVIRFGGIADRDVDPAALLKSSLEDSGWRLRTAISAGDANRGRRQAAQFVHGGPAPKEEYDFYAVPA